MDLSKLNSYTYKYHLNLALKFIQGLPSENEKIFAELWLRKLTENVHSRVLSKLLICLRNGRLHRCFKTSTKNPVNWKMIEKVEPSEIRRDFLYKNFGKPLPASNTYAIVQEIPTIGGHLYYQTLPHQIKNINDLQREKLPVGTIFLRPIIIE